MCLHVTPWLTSRLCACQSRRGSRLRGAAPAAHSGMNLLEVMQQGITGRGVGVVIIDDGVEHNHTDIRHAFVSYQTCVCELSNTRL